MFMKRTDNNLLTKWWLGVDKVVLFAVLGLIVFGALMVCSTGPYAAQRARLDELFYIKKMLVYIPVGIVSLFVLSFMKIKWLRYGACTLFLILLPSLFVALAFPETKGARRWITLPGVFKIQPSEFFKPIFALVVAMILSRIKELHNREVPVWQNKRERNYILLLLGIFGLVILALSLQKDLGMTLTYTVIFFAEVLVAGLSWKWILVLSGFGITGLGCAFKFMPHVVRRLTAFHEGSYQLDMSLKAIGESGILFGGSGNNIKKLIPDVHTDFIFAGIVENFGPVIATLIVAVFFSVILHILGDVYQKNNKFIVYSVVGIVSYLTFQITINLSSTLGIIPTKGMTLPFISYGGSSFVSSCIAIGIILSLLQDQNLRR